MHELRSDFERRSKDLQSQVETLAETVHRETLGGSKRSSE